MTSLFTWSAGRGNVRAIRFTAGALGLAAVATLVLSACSFGGGSSSPKITDQPRDQSGFIGLAARFDVGAEGDAPLAYQWSRDGVAISGATGPTYVTPALTLADTGAKFSVVVSNGKGSVKSNDATLTVNPVPTITADPADQTVNIGATATFTVTGSGASLTYQWRRDDIPIAGATAASFTTPATVAGDDGAVFSADVVNGSGFVTSAGATLHVLGPAAIVAPPASQTVNVGQAAIFSVAGTGGNLTYQWHVGGTDIPGATAPVYTTPAATLADNGAAYSVTVTSAASSVTSADAILTVASLPNAPLAALPAEIGASRSPGTTLSFSAARKQDGTVLSWGDNSLGQRGVGTVSSPSETPATVTLPTGKFATQIAVGGDHALLLLNDGTVYSWGSNSGGQLGLGDTAVRATPTLVTLPRSAVGIAAGLAHSVALLDDGTIYAWGTNGFGELGTDNRIAGSTLPVQVVGVTTAVAVAAGNDHTLALLADGTVVAWGLNGSGQLGDGTFKLKRAPVSTGLQDVARIRAGSNGSVAITNHRVVLAWGLNADSQLGRGPGFSSNIPTPTGVFADGVDAAPGARLLLIVGSDGLVRGAGANESGSIGDGTNSSRNVFTQATVLSNIIAVATGGESFSLALAADGSVFAWGDNSAKQLGNTAIAATGTFTPTQVPGLDLIP